MKPIFKLFTEARTSKNNKFTYYSVSGVYADGSSDLHIIRTIINENQKSDPPINLKLKYEWLKENHPELLI